jgi:hypothetical protein
MQTIGRAGPFGTVPATASVPDERGADALALLGRIADYLTIVAMFFVPLFVPNLGGITGVTAADVIVAFALMARGLHVMVAGFPRAGLRRHSYLLGLLVLFAGAGMVSLVVNHESPLTWGYWRLVFSTAGSVFLVATYGRQNTWEHNRVQLLRAYGLGCLVLALSTVQGPQIQGRPIGWSLHPNSMGHSCVMGIGTSVWLLENLKGRYERWFWTGTALACAFGVMQSGSRGGLFGLWVGVMLYLCLRGSRRAVVGAIVGTWLASMLLAFGVVTLPANNPITRILHKEETGSIYSDQQRGEYLEHDYALISDHPIFGVGFSDDLLIINVHVVYLQGWLAAGAVAGFVTILIGLTCLFLAFVTRKRDLALASAAAAVAVAWIVTNILQFRDQWLFLAIAFGSAQSISVLRARDPDELSARPELEGVA